MNVRSSGMGSSIPAADVLRIEEEGEVAVDLQQPGASELHGFVRVGQEVHVAELIEASPELLDDVHAELVPEVLLIKRARLELEDHLTDEPVALGCGQGPV